MNARTIRRAAERQARKADIKAQRAQTYAATPELTATADLANPTPAQVAANRANAQLSCGPTSIEGKAISSRNHTVHGLTASITGGPFQVLPTENQAEYDRVLGMYMNEWNPATATELDLVERMATHAWLRHRAQRLQDERLAQGMTDMKDYKQFEVLGRYYTTHLRAYNKAFADLVRLKRFQMTQKKDEAMLQRRAQDVQIRFESQKRKAEEHAAKMESIRLKQEAQKQRNSRLKTTETAAPATEVAETQSA